MASTIYLPGGIHAEVNCDDRSHPGPGWVPLERGALRQAGDIWYNMMCNAWEKTHYPGRVAQPGRSYFRYCAASTIRIPHEDD